RPGRATTDRRRGPRRVPVDVLRRLQQSSHRQRQAIRSRRRRLPGRFWHWLGRARLDLLRYANGVPLCAATTCLPAQHFPDAARIGKASVSITCMLTLFCGCHYTCEHTHVVAAIANTEDVASLRGSARSSLADSR